MVVGTNFLFRCSLVISICLPSQGAAEVPNYADYDFTQFLDEHNKSYTPSEMQQRRLIFETNYAKVVTHNQKYLNGHLGWFMRLNAFADWTRDEFAALLSTKYAPNNLPLAAYASNGPNPKAVDWRDHGVVTRVKNQGQCGSCWAFAAAETVESHFAIKTRRQLVLAPQAYVDCVVNSQECGGTGGCGGATMELAYNLTVERGIPEEFDLPYKAKDEPCPQYRAAVKASGFVKLPENDAQALETAIASIGPVGITVAADQWMFYGGGIFHGCSNLPAVTLNHGVQLVGYTPEAWIVRNSWGPNWGEKGYIRLSRASDQKTFIDRKPADGSSCKPYPKTIEVGGECGLLFDTAYPTGVAAVEAVFI